MSIVIPESELPQELTAGQAVEAAYASTLATTASDLLRGLPVLVECDKDLIPFLFINLRSRLKKEDLRCLLLDGRQQEPADGMPPQGVIGTMISQLRDAVRGAIDQRVVVLPHLDLLATSVGGLTAEAKEVVALLYENPELVWLGFKDPSFPLPRVIENLFPHRYSILGIARDRLPSLITQKESRKFGREFRPWTLYKYVSGMNAARLRKLLSTLEGEDYPHDPSRAYTQIRQATSGGKLELPQVDLHQDIGGYTKVKQRLSAEILDVLAKKDQCTSATEIARLEDLIPRGMIFWGRLVPAKRCLPRRWLPRSVRRSRLFPVRNSKAAGSVRAKKTCGRFFTAPANRLPPSSSLTNSIPLQPRAVRSPARASNIQWSTSC